MQRLHRFLALLPKPFRRRAATCFSNAARRGCATPAALLAAVQDDIRFEHEVSAFFECQDAGNWQHLGSLLESHPQAAHEMAEWALWWATLSPSERDALRRPQASSEPVAVSAQGTPIAVVSVAQADVLQAGIDSARRKEAVAAAIRRKYFQKSSA